MSNKKVFLTMLSAMTFMVIPFNVGAKEEARIPKGTSSPIEQSAADTAQISSPEPKKGSQKPSVAPIVLETPAEIPVQEDIDLNLTNNQGNDLDGILNRLSRLSDYEAAQLLQKRLALMKMVSDLQKTEIELRSAERKFNDDLRKSTVNDLAGYNLGNMGSIPQGGGNFPRLGGAAPQMRMPTVPVAEPQRMRMPNEEPSMRVVSIHGLDNEFLAQILNDGGLLSLKEGDNIDAKNKIISISSQGVKVSRESEDENGKITNRTVILPFARN